ncbi:asparagine synthase (glutamine-hydrolyzing) [Actinokineospora sp. UTMC 2448]|uniref:asparagine synthase (glutamine-hydrolyzing) n=1 Tax=Actinokineospora sp. UTMC 2448 TaxID=2268449 RepID=UPI0021645B01|nr:asparagine synthase (glutamine-hydrolyzing) [Actinokineospora sp. UTMC 2448]UVS78753.1 Asparagine synthetase [glutamine-hydrolyzing] 3 [Actinokineospora sp. UTMC 2448]
MCGIAGWVDFGRDLSAERGTARAMTETMACRGPDDSGLWIDGPVALGHRRLAVIDPEGGRQPMVDAGVAITFCGEVYNFGELRARLIGHGHRFTTRSDTEVVLRAYRQWGAAMAARLNGMYAMGIWDAGRRELLLLRDRMGVKPLYYYPLPDGVLFGSEPKAILANPRARRRLDADGLYEILDMVKTPERTVFTGMAEVRPGQLVRVGRAGISKDRYWRLTAREHHDDLPTTISTVREILADTVDRQLVADVPVCTLLSGGLDSSSVTALAARALAGPVRSFSVDFAGERFEADAVRGESDAPFVRDVVDHVGADHTEVLLDSDGLTDERVRAAVLRAADIPPAYWGDMWPSLYLLFRAVRERSTVALSGEAADELFGGYRWFRNPAAIAAATFPWLTSGSARYFGGASLLDPGLVAGLDIPGRRAEAYRAALAEAPVLPGESADERRMREITYLNLTRFLQTLLDRKDRMSMATGLEVRVPFCDHRLVEYVFNVPWRMKSFDGREKSLLRAAVADLLPLSVRERRKTPYPATQSPAYERALCDELGKLVVNGDAPVLPLLDMAKAQQVIDRPTRAVSLPYDRGGLELALWLNRWLESYQVTIDL